MAAEWVLAELVRLVVGFEAAGAVLGVRSLSVESLFTGKLPEHSEKELEPGLKWEPVESGKELEEDRSGRTFIITFGIPAVGKWVELVLESEGYSSESGTVLAVLFIPVGRCAGSSKVEELEPPGEYMSKSGSIFSMILGTCGW